MKPIPFQLAAGPFTHRRAQALGVSPRMLEGRRFIRVFPGVYRLASYELTHHDWIHAARLALPADARLTGITRIQELGLDYGPRFPLRFVVARDHHIDLDGVFLHRTKAMPPSDDLSVTPAAAFISYCSLTRLIDAIKVGDWLLHQGLMSTDELHDLATAQLWRKGADEALLVRSHLDGHSRSLPESETRCLLTSAGLPKPHVNRPMQLAPGVIVMGDLWYPEFNTVVEYEGSQHQEDRGQYQADIERYALFRDHSQQYVQVTKEKLRRPTDLVLEVHRQLTRNGYAGPAPVFGDQWRVLFMSVADAVGPRRYGVVRA